MGGDDGDSDSESQSYNDSEGDDDSIEDELRLESMDEIEEQVEFLQSELKKLGKIVKTLKNKSKGNDELIVALKNDINILRGGKGIELHNETKTDDADDLLGGLFDAPVVNKTPQIKQTNDTPSEVKKDDFKTGSGFGGWTTF